MTTSMMGQVTGSSLIAVGLISTRRSVCFGTVAAVLLVHTGRSIFLLGLLVDLVAVIVCGLYSERDVCSE